jgi:hypothetical protein
MIRRYLEKKGLEELLQPEQVICLDAVNDISLESVYQKLQEICGSVDMKDIAVGGVQNEFKYDEFGRQLRVLTLDASAPTNIGMYKSMVEMLALAEAAPPNPYLKEDGQRKGWFMYLPPAVPADYREMYEEYRRYIEDVLSKA